MKTSRTDWGLWRTGRISSRKRWVSPHTDVCSVVGKKLRGGKILGPTCCILRSSEAGMLLSKGTGPWRTLQLFLFLYQWVWNAPLPSKGDIILRSAQPSHWSFVALQLVSCSLYKNRLWTCLNKYRFGNHESFQTVQQVFQGSLELPQITGPFVSGMGAVQERATWEAQPQSPAWTKKPHFFLLHVLSLHVWFYFTKVLLLQRAQVLCFTE